MEKSENINKSENYNKLENIGKFEKSDNNFNKLEKSDLKIENHNVNEFDNLNDIPIRPDFSSDEEEELLAEDKLFLGILLKRNKGGGRCCEEVRKWEVEKVRREVEKKGGKWEKGARIKEEGEGSKDRRREEGGGRENKNKYFMNANS